MEELDSELNAFQESKNSEIESLKQNLEDKELLIFDSMETVRANTETISMQLNALAQQYGIQISSSIINAWKSGENAISEYENVLTVKSSVFTSQLQLIEGEINRLKTAADNTAVSASLLFSLNGSNLLNQFQCSADSIGNVRIIAELTKQALYTAFDPNSYKIDSLINKINSAAGSAGNLIQSLGNLDIEDITKQITNLEKKIIGFKQGMPSRSVKPGTDIMNNILSVIPGLGSLLSLSSRAAGGLVTKDPSNPLNALARAVGEDTLIAAKDGEYVLNQAQTKGFLQLTDMLPMVDTLMGRFSSPPLPDKSSLLRAASPSSIIVEPQIHIAGDVTKDTLPRLKDLTKDISYAVKSDLYQELKTLGRRTNAY